jgi:hypothetical protein
MMNYTLDDDVTESSIFDLDNAPAPRLSNNTFVQQQNAIMMMSSTSTVPPPPSSSLAPNTNILHPFGRSSSLSPRPPNGISSNRVRQSITQPIGDSHCHRTSLSPTDQQPRTTGSIAASTSTMAPINLFNRRRLLSQSSIPSVGGNTTYGQPFPMTRNTISFTSPSHDFNTNRQPKSTRRRAYSAAAELFSSALPSDLAHVRSFPPMIGADSIAGNSTGERRLSWYNESMATTTTTPTTNTAPIFNIADAPTLPFNQQYSSSITSNSMPIPSIDETKESVDDDTIFDANNLDVDDPLFMNHESGRGDDVRMIQRTDTNISSDGGWSLVAEEQQPHAFHTPQHTQQDPVAMPQPPHDEFSSSRSEHNHHPTYNDDDEDDDDTTLPNQSTTIKPIRLFGCIKLPLWFSKRRISWNRTLSFLAQNKCLYSLLFKISRILF